MSKRVTFTCTALLLLGMGACYLFCALTLIGVSTAEVLLFRPGATFPSPFPVMVVVIAMYGSVLALLHWLLYSPAFDEHLHP